MAEPSKTGEAWPHKGPVIPDIPEGQLAVDATTGYYVFYKALEQGADGGAKAGEGRAGNHISAAFCNGYGFIAFRTEDEAAKAMEGNEHRWVSHTE